MDIPEDFKAIHSVTQAVRVSWVKKTSFFVFQQITYAYDMVYQQDIPNEEPL